MASTIDFSTFEDHELLYGYQRVNRARFPDNFFACGEEIVRRGLSAPEKFEINPLHSDLAVNMFQRVSERVASLAQAVTKRQPSPQA